MIEGSEIMRYKIYDFLEISIYGNIKIDIAIVEYIKNKHGIILAISSLFLLYNPISYRSPIYIIIILIKTIVTYFERIDLISEKREKSLGKCMDWLKYTDKKMMDTSIETRRNTFQGM